VIRYFRANVEEADPGDTIVLEWESVGAAEASLFYIPSSGYMSPGWPVDTTGVYTDEIGPQRDNWIEYFLYVRDELGREARANLTVRLRCPVPWFFSPAPRACPTDPVISDAAEQHFEHGTTIWFREPWVSGVDEGGWIFVLYEDRGQWFSYKWYVYEDEWIEGEADRDPSLTPPPGLYQPVRGFGFLWRQNPQVRERLGWAVDQEVGFSTILQHTAVMKYRSTYLRALDGNVWYLGPERSSWEKILVEQ
jgi:hypothetical protein